MKKPCTTFPQNLVSVVEQSSGRQVMLNCHCEGHVKGTDFALDSHFYTSEAGYLNFS